MKESLSFMQTPKTRNEAADAILGDTYKLLDHGFVRLVDYMGGDADIEQAARVSYDAGASSRKVSETRGLIRYLMRHRHCYAPEMEVLTMRGWLRWDNCESSETFLVPDPKTREELCGPDGVEVAWGIVSYYI